MSDNNRGFEYARNYSMFDAIFKRRTHRISKGLKSIPAGSLSYTSEQEIEPLTPLEEAMLIAVTGTTGITMPDRPFQSPDGTEIMGSPNITMTGRAAGSVDNSQATHFFLINDSGTYYLNRLEPGDADLEFTPENLIARAEKSKQRVSSKRLDFPREFPYYLDSNRFLSNLPGTTLLVPVVDLSRQYINGIMYLLTQPDGDRPAFLDDRNFYRPAGVKKWIKNGFLNKEIKLPLSLLGTFRTDIESNMLMQNLFLTTQALGLGGWIHAGFASPFLLSNPYLSPEGYGLGFRYVTPKFKLFDIFRWGVPFPKYRANPVGLDGIIEGMCPPYYNNMSDAVDAFLEAKYGPGGVYKDQATFEKVFNDGFAEPYLKEVPHYTQDVIDCAKDICNYIYKQHGRFPAHVDAIFVPGIWIQVHHIDTDYYDYLFRNGYADSQRVHQELWHSPVTADSTPAG